MLSEGADRGCAMADVFISYASAEKDKARLIAESLEAAGFSVWWDRALKPGETFDKVIQREIDAAKAIIVLWTRTSVESQWVREEADVGRKRDALVPILMEAVEPPIGFGRVQAANLADWDGDPKAHDWEEVVESVQKLVGRAAQPGWQRKRAPSATRAAKKKGPPWLVIGLAATVVVLIALVSQLIDGITAQQAQIANQGAMPVTAPAAPPQQTTAPQQPSAQIYAQPTQTAQPGVDPYAQALAMINPAAGQLQLTARAAGLTYICVTTQGWCPMNQPGPPGNACWCPNSYGQPVSGVTQ